MNKFNSKIILKSTTVLGILLGSTVATTTFADSWVATQPSDIHIDQNTTLYQLRRGDTLWAISQKINVPVTTLATLSHVDLTTGQQYRLPIGYTVSWSEDRSSVILTNQTGNIVSQATTDSNGNVTVTDMNTAPQSTVPSIITQTASIAPSTVNTSGTPTIVGRTEQVADGVTVVHVAPQQPTDVDNTTNQDIMTAVGDGVTSTKDTLHFSNGDALTSSKDELHFSNGDSVTSNKDPLYFTNGTSITSSNSGNTLQFATGQPLTQPAQPTLHVPTYDGDDKVTFINGVKNYSANFILIESDGHYGLFDAGSSRITQKDYDGLIKYLKDAHITTLDFVLASHLDSDHISTLSRVVSHETRTLFDDFTIKTLYIKVPEDTTNYHIASVLKKTGAEFYAENTKIYNDIVDKATESGTTVATVSNNFDVTLGDFKLNILNTQAATDAEKGNYYNNLDSMVMLVSKTDTNKDTYNILLTGDLEGYDIVDTVNQLKDLGVSQLDGYELNHHGYSQHQKESHMIPETFNTPITTITNVEGNVKDRPDYKYNDIVSTYTNGLYWQGAGSVQYNFSNTESNGVVVDQEDNVVESHVTHNDGAQRYTQITKPTAPGHEELTTDKLSTEYDQEINALVQSESTTSAESSQSETAVSTPAVTDTSSNTSDVSTTSNSSVTNTESSQLSSSTTDTVTQTTTATSVTN